MNTVQGSIKQNLRDIINNLERRFRETQSNWIKEEIESYMSAIPCDKCHGRHCTFPESLSVTVGGINISEFCDKSITEALEFVNDLKL